MTDTTDGEESTTDRAESVERLVASSTYKVRGELDADSGPGVPGRNTADSGTPIGIEGAVPNNSAGYGLSTPHDARVAGTAELGRLAGSVTGGQTVTDLLGDALTPGSGPWVVDDGDGTATVGLDRNLERLEFQKLENDTTDCTLGRDVALDADGTTAFAGSPYEPTEFVDETGDPTDPGELYVFDGLGGWSGVGTGSQKVPSRDVASGDRFGRGVAVGRDSQTAFVGVPGEDDSSGNSDGAAYAFYGTARALMRDVEDRLESLVDDQQGVADD